MARKRKRANLRPEAWYPTFLATLSATGNVRIACTNAKIARWTAYRHRRRNAEFAQGWELALGDGGDVLEFAAWKRVQGIKMTKLILYRGEPVIDWSVPGKWVDDQGNDWQEGVSKGRKRWTGAFLVEEEIRYSDTLLVQLLKAAKPEKYGNRATMTSDQMAVRREVNRLAEELEIPVEDLLERARELRLSR